MLMSGYSQIEMSGLAMLSTLRFTARRQRDGTSRPDIVTVIVCGGVAPSF